MYIPNIISEDEFVNSMTALANLSESDITFEKQESGMIAQCGDTIILTFLIPIQELRIINKNRPTQSSVIAVLYYNGEWLNHEKISSAQIMDNKVLQRRWGIKPFHYFCTNEWQLFEEVFKTLSSKMPVKNVYNYCDWTPSLNEYIYGNLCISANGITEVCSNIVKSKLSLAECSSKEVCEFISMIAPLLTRDTFTGITIIIFYLLSLLKSRFYTKISILPSFALSIIGATGTFKTTVSKAACNPIGIPCSSFEDTPAAIKRMLQGNTNGVTILDDFNCQTDVKLRKFEDVIRLCGDITSNANRVEGSKVTSDVTTGMVVFTGEVEPNVQPSSAPRMLMLNFDSDTVDSGILSEFTANLPIYRSFIILFIQEVMHTDNFDYDVESEVIAIRDEFRRTTSGLHGRYYEMYAWMAVMWRLFQKLLQKYGTNVEFDYETAIKNHIIAQHKHFDIDPVNMFLFALNELIEANALTVVHYFEFKAGKSFDVIDETGTLFIKSGSVYDKVCSYYHKADRPFNISERALRKQLSQRGILKHPNSSKGTLTQERKTNDNKSVRGIELYAVFFTSARTPHINYCKAEPYLARS